MITPFPTISRREAEIPNAAPSVEASSNILNLLVKGAIIFDVDETLLEVTVDRIEHRRLEETLAESHALPVVAELLIKGFQLCAITGNVDGSAHPRLVGE